MIWSRLSASSLPLLRFLGSSHMVIAGKNGHVASFDWQAGKMHFELQLRESVRDITCVDLRPTIVPFSPLTNSFLRYLHNQSHVAVAQKQHVFIYDQDGVELHRLNAHVDVTRLEFLPFHWLLASVGNAGYLKYTDTSTGTLISEQRTKLGASRAMAQNVHNAVIYLGHQNGKHNHRLDSNRLALSFFALLFALFSFA